MDETTDTGIDPVLAEFQPDLSAIRPEPRPVASVPGWWGRYSISSQLGLPMQTNAFWAAAGALVVLAVVAAGR